MRHVIHWFRQDLRLSDNPALTAASKYGLVMPIYILDDVHSKKHKMGGASRVWLNDSLQALNQSLDDNLGVFRGDPMELLPQLIKTHDIEAIFWNRCYEPWRIKRDAKIKQMLKESGVEVQSFNGSLLWEPWEILKQDQTPYKVFTPYYRRGCLNALPPRKPIAKPKNLKLLSLDKSRLRISNLDLLPKIRWDQSMLKNWQPGELGAKNRLKQFLRSGIEQYKEGRNFPALKHVSRLSPHLHFGEGSPNQIWYAAIDHFNGAVKEQNLDTLLSELGWREFAHYLLYHFPGLPEKNLQSKFDAFAWQRDSLALKNWQQGLTGYPIVDAGMRELWQTGYMHNRVRMIVGSFLVKNLLIDWREGERWFWDCLFDADLANNAASWQWVAGCGADAAPYFRIFNPITQGQKFDCEGHYTRQFIPELSKLPNKYLFSPWEAPKEVLSSANIELGVDYPWPLVDVKASRERALEVFARLKS